MYSDLSALSLPGALKDATILEAGPVRAENDGVKMPW